MYGIRSFFRVPILLQDAQDSHGRHLKTSIKHDFMISGNVNVPKCVYHKYVFDYYPLLPWHG